MSEDAKQQLERPMIAFHVRSTGSIAEQPFHGVATPRHKRQIGSKAAHRRTRDLLLDQHPLQIALGTAFEIDAERRLCLFNVLVALEWVPSARFLSELRDAFDRAADLLFDVTDGLMTFGQVLIGGPEWMECADIQIFASTRLFPRSSVSGLLDERKYQPIRLGRGLWSKQEETVLPWNAGPGPATLAHEWSHYALGLKDQYLEFDRSEGIVFPRNSLVENTLMASLEKSELLATPSQVDRPGCDDSEWSFLAHNPHYRALRIDPGQHPREQPSELVPLPAFRIAESIRGAGQEAYVAPPAGMLDGRQIASGRYWAYVLKGGLKRRTPRALIGQGSVGGSGQLPELFGLEAGDDVLLASRDQNDAPMVVCGRVGSLHGDQASVAQWRDCTPHSLPALLVAATSTDARPPYTLTVDGAAAEQITLFPLGQRSDSGKHAHVVGGNTASDLRVLDGHVLVRDAQGGVVVAAYSVGGSPSSGYPAHPNPIPAGSSDGNAMLFFYDTEQECLDAATAFQQRQAATQAERVHIVVTTRVLNDVAPPAGHRPCSYSFGVASNMSFAELNGGNPAALAPTLVLYYDQGAFGAGDGSLVVCRLEQGGWAPITHAARQLEDKWFVAAPIDGENAPGLYEQPPRAEQYQLFMAPGSRQ